MQAAKNSYTTYHLRKTRNDALKKLHKLYDKEEKTSKTYNKHLK